jgi:hypothetical protein
MKQLFVMAFLIFLAACNNEDEHIQQIKMLSESLQQSTAIIKHENGLVISILKDKLSDFDTPASSNIWKQKAEQVHQLSANMSHYIRQQASKPGEKNTADSLINRLNRFKDSALALFHPHQLDAHSFYKEILSKNIDSVKNKYPFKTRLSGLKNHSAWLNKLDNEVAVCENVLVNQCNQFVSYGCNLYRVYSFIGTQNTSYCKPGDTVIVMAGMGYLSTAMHPIFTIDGKQIPVGPEAFAEYRVKAGKQPGKYSIPLTISFNRVDGENITVHKKIEYEVAVP